MTEKDKENAWNLVFLVTFAAIIIVMFKMGMCK